MNSASLKGCETRRHLGPLAATLNKVAKRAPLEGVHHEAAGRCAHSAGL